MQLYCGYTVFELTIVSWTRPLWFTRLELTTCVRFLDIHVHALTCTCIHELLRIWSSTTRELGLLQSLCSFCLLLCTLDWKCTPVRLLSLCVVFVQSLFTFCTLNRGTPACKNTVQYRCTCTVARFCHEHRSCNGHSGPFRSYSQNSQRVY